MATATYVQRGDSIDYTPGGDISAGDVVVQNDLVGVAKKDISANALGALAVVGVFDFPKATGSGEAISAGAVVYWDSGNSVMTATSDSNTEAGHAIADAADADTTVRVRLAP